MRDPWTCRRETNVARQTPGISGNAWYANHPPKYTCFRCLQSPNEPSRSPIAEKNRQETHSKATQAIGVHFCATEGCEETPGNHTKGDPKEVAAGGARQPSKLLVGSRLPSTRSLDGGRQPCGEQPGEQETARRAAKIYKFIGLNWKPIRWYSTQVVQGGVFPFCY